MILCIETSAISCSIALSDKGKLLAYKETKVKNSHSGVITVFINDVMHEAKVDFKSLEAVAVSKGPGSFTGLRIGVSTAKGLCYSLDIPLIAIPTLQSMAWGIIQNSTFNIQHLFCPMLDARRMEVYHAIYNKDLHEVKPTCAEIITSESFKELLDKNKIVFFGDGAEKCKSIIAHENAVFIDDIYPSAKDMIALAETSYESKEFENVSYFEPYYLKDFVAGKPKVKGLR